MTRASALPATGIWAIDPEHTIIRFSVRHLMATKVRGSFQASAGSITVDDELAQSTVVASIEAAFIDTGAGDRDDYLRSADFLDVDRFPTLEFRSTDVRPARRDYEMDGELTVREVTRPVTLAVSYLGITADGEALFRGSTRINREDWDLSWSQVLETGGWLVGKTVDIELEVQATREEE